MTDCPLCGEEMGKVLYLGVPGKYCPDPECGCLMGPAYYAAAWFQVEDGGWSLMTYEGSYLLALWRFLRYGKEEQQ